MTIDSEKRGGGIVSNTDAIKPNTFTEGSRELGYPAHVYPYAAGIVGGAIGGVAMIVPAVIYGFLSGKGIWYPVNLVAATFMREMQGMALQELTAFAPSWLAVGLVTHLTVASSIGLIFALLLPTLPGRPVLWALIVGPLLWFGATIIVLPQINPVMSQLLDWPSFAAANIVYGLVMGLWVAATPEVDAEKAHHLRFNRPSIGHR
jgi:hypothetical protein